MKTIRVQYTVKKEFVETNKANIQAVMDELRSQNNANVQYSAFLLEDGQTFMHFVVLKDEEAGTVVPGLQAFKAFQTALKASQPEVPPKSEVLDLVGSAHNYFN